MEKPGHLVLLNWALNLFVTSLYLLRSVAFTLKLKVLVFGDLPFMLTVLHLFPSNGLKMMSGGAGGFPRTFHGRVLSVLQSPSAGRRGN